MVISFKRSCACTVVFSAPDAAAGHCRPMPPPEIFGYSQASLAQSLVGTLFFSSGFWCAQDFLCALQESVSPVQWKFWNQIPLASKVKFSGIIFLCPTFQCTIIALGFPGGSVVKNPPAHAGDEGLIPGLGRSPGGRNDTPLQYSCLGNLLDRGAWQATAYRVAKSWTRLKQLSTCVSLL